MCAVEIKGICVGNGKLGVNSIIIRRNDKVVKRLLFFRTAKKEFGIITYAGTFHNECVW